MSKRVISLFVLSALAVGAYFAQGATAAPVSLAPASVSPSAAVTASVSPTAAVCVVQTGFEAGRVNLRTCGATSCAVIRVLREGERLTVTAPGAWLQVVTADGAAGFVNSKFCK